MTLGCQMAPAEKFRYILSCEIKRVIKSNLKKQQLLASLCYIYKTRKHVGKRAICQTKLPMSKCQKAFEASILQLLLGLPVRRLSACSIEVLRGQQIKLIHSYNILKLISFLQYVSKQGQKLLLSNNLLKRVKF